MESLLRISDEFRVKKEIGKDKFLEKGNLTNSERMLLKQDVLDIQVKYDVKCQDGTEVLFINVNTALPKDKWSFRNIASAIARSLPYHSVLYTHCGDYGQISSFIIRRNAMNDCRSTIIRQSASRCFDRIEMSTATKIMLSNMEDVICEGPQTANELVNSLFLIFDQDKTLSAYRWEMIAKKRRAFAEKVHSIRENGFQEEERWLFAEEDPEDYFDETDESYYHSAQDELCSALIRWSFDLYQEIFLLEDGEEYLSEEEWLWYYRNICEKVIEDSGEELTDPLFLEKLVTAFYEKRDESTVYPGEEDWYYAVLDEINETFGVNLEM